MPAAVVALCAGREVELAALLYKRFHVLVRPGFVRLKLPGLLCQAAEVANVVGLIAERHGNSGLMITLNLSERQFPGRVDAFRRWPQMLCIGLHLGNLPGEFLYPGLHYVVVSRHHKGGSHILQVLHKMEGERIAGKAVCGLYEAGFRIVIRREEICERAHEHLLHLIFREVHPGALFPFAVPAVYAALKGTVQVLFLYRGSVTDIQLVMALSNTEANLPTICLNGS